MIAQVRESLTRLPPGPVALIGSSLGAFVAVHAAAASRSWNLPARIDRLVLLAPALDFGRTRLASMGDAEVARWRDTDRLDVFHHAYGRTLPLRYGLYEDAARYDGFALRLDLPILIFQGTRDDVVDPSVASRWAEGRSHVDLRLVDDGHQLLSSLETIWLDTFSFLNFGYDSASPSAS